MKAMPEELEQELRYIAGMCARGRISWDTKEAMLDVALRDFGWTRQDLRDYNKWREENEPPN